MFSPILRRGSLVSAHTARLIAIAAPRAFSASVHFDCEDVTETAPSTPGRSTTLRVPDFNDSRVAFESKTTPELLRAAACFQLSRIGPLVHHAEEMLQWSNRIVGQRITDAALRATLYGHFCAGQDLDRIGPVLQRQSENGIGSILDYAAEDDGTPSSGSNSENTRSLIPGAREYDYENEEQCDKHLGVFQKCIQDAAALSKDSFAAIKVTALGNPKLLARMSEAVVETKNLFKKFDTNEDGFISREEFKLGYKTFFDRGDVSINDIFDQYSNGTGEVDYIAWSMSLKPTDLPEMTKACKEQGPLVLATPTEEEVELIDAMYRRGHELTKTAAKHGTRLLVDAEQVRFQPAIDSLVLDLQRTFNAKDVSDFPIVYNTYQCYLKDASERLEIDFGRSERFDYHFGAKLVRGAYMESERFLAASKNLPSPIHDTIQDSHDCYNNAVDFLLSQAGTSDNKVELMCATHNQESIEKAIYAMNKYGIDVSDMTITFAQLYGMKDELTYGLGKFGYRSYKYVPYGEVHEVIPYLLRRARENSSVVGGASKELTMIKRELGRRLNPFASQFS